MLDQTLGFTHAGVEQLNDSIRTYVWAILGAQDEERAPILGSRVAFTAQKRFLTNVEAAITQERERGGRDTSHQIPKRAAVCPRQAGFRTRRATVYVPI